MTIEALFPVPRLRQPADKPPVAHAWRALPARPVLGLIDNTKARARELLQAIGAELRARGVVADVFVHTKPSPSYPITAAERAEIAARAHLIVSGVGD